MARFIRALQLQLQHKVKPSLLRLATKQRGVRNQFPTLRKYSSEAVTTTGSSIPFRTIIQSEIDYQSHPPPPSQPATRFGIFEISDRPGDQVIKLKGKFGECEEIEIEVGMFDGCIFVPTDGEGDESDGTIRHIHLSLLIHVKKGDGMNQLKIVCSAWPDNLEIQKLAVLPRDQSKHTSYMGPYLKSLDKKIQIPIYEYLEERGIGDGLAYFLHEHMKNKDRMEQIRWFQKLQSLVE